MTPNTPTVPMTPALVLFLLPSTHPVSITSALTLFSLPQNSHCSHYPNILAVPISLNSPNLSHYPSTSNFSHDPISPTVPITQHSHCSHDPNTPTVPITPALTLFP